MTTKVQLGFDKAAAWEKVKGRVSIVLDTNCWIDMADDKCPDASAMKGRLQDLVSQGRIFCPLSWGLINELLKQPIEFRRRTAMLMNDLSLNVAFVNRSELYEWEIGRSMQRLMDGQRDGSLSGLYAPVAAYAGSRFSLELRDGISIPLAAQDHLRDYMKRELAKLGIIDIATTMTARDIESPAYSEAAKNSMALTKGDKERLFVIEATEIFKIYVLPVLETYPPAVKATWRDHIERQATLGAFVQNYLVDLPALHNYIEIMATATSQPSKKDKINDFFDYEIVTAPLAYASAFVSRDKGIRDLLTQRTTILNRTTCHYCDGLEALEAWLKDNRYW